LCPGTDGESVFQARALYLLVNGEPYEAAPCIDEGARLATPPKGILAERVDDLKVVIHPNPSTESVNIRLNKKVSGLQLIVADISGRTLLQKEYRSESNSYFFPYQLEPGVYFFTILTVDENFTKKVIVTR
jgi:hypothetical protein